ncbi:trimethyllysine dioxygenase [Coniochaeta sp. PMI_546]|nr:trimethyllysine dioxygenase [Coniochaeta sp. PMI_546]
MRGVLGFPSRLARARPYLPNLQPAHFKLGLRHETTASETRSKSWESLPERLKPVKIVDQGISVNIGTSPKRSFLPGIWLRDNCRCSSCVNQDTMQRNFNTFDIPATIRPKEATSHREALAVTWPDGHQSEYPWEFISHYLKNDYRNVDESRDPRPLLFGPDIAKDPPSVDYQRVMLPDDSGVAELTDKIKTHGFVFVNNTPYDDPEDTKRLLERIAFIRVTHYGGFYDFTPDLSMADTAYTNIALPAHTDTTYFTDPAGLQSFHLLSHTPAPETVQDTQPEGGKSLLVDGFGAARKLLLEDPLAYKILSKVRLPWHASGNKGITIAPDKRYPVLELDEDTGELHRVRWNNDDRGVVPWDNEYSPEQWYEAARKWDSILRRQDIQCWIQLVPGKVLIFDNWRVLHGRSAFTGIRRICGAYINRDDFISRWRNTNFDRKELLKVIG